MSAAAGKVMESFAALMQELAATDPSAWEPDEVIGFADGIAMINNIMQSVKETIVATQQLTVEHG